MSDTRFTGVRAPLAKAKGLGAAHDGSHHWIVQRITAVSNLVLVTWFVFSVISLLGKEHYEVMQFFASGLNAALMSLFIISTFYHAVLGLQVVAEDYVSSKGKLITFLLVTKLGLYGLGFACVLAIAKMHFAG